MNWKCVGDGTTGAWKRCPWCLTDGWWRIGAVCGMCLKCGRTSQSHEVEDSVFEPIPDEGDPGDEG
jgi:hypothetical protein